MVGDADQCVETDLLDHKSSRRKKLASKTLKEHVLDLLASEPETAQIRSVDRARDSNEQLW